jgi:small-conductance mechanosensitive channel
MFSFDAFRSSGTALLGVLPRVFGAIIVILIALLVARSIRWASERALRSRAAHANLRTAMGRLVFTAVVAVGVLIAATIAFPTFTVGSLIQLLGVSGVVIGFAFKDIFQNFLAGILLLVADPFEIGDQIIVENFEGTVKEVQGRATVIETYDRRNIIVPNADLFTKVVTVNTAHHRREGQYDIVIKGATDVLHIQEVLQRTVRGGIEGVDADPLAAALLVSIGAGALTFRILWWSGSERSEFLAVQDRVLTKVFDALRAENLLTA